MSVVATDIVVYGAANVAETDGVTQGGAIDTTVRYVFDDATLANTLNDTVDVVSDDAGDTTQTVTVTGRDAGGAIVSEVFSLNGLTIQNGAQTFERILKIVKSASTTGNITVERNSDATDIGVLEPALLEMRRPFYNVSADAAGGSSREFYEKLFVRNNNGTNDLLGATIKENADSLSKITFDLEDAKDDNNQTADRLDTAPTGMQGSFDSADKTVPGTDLGSGEAIGVWIKLTLAAGDAAAKGTWTIEVTGSTT